MLSARLLACSFAIALCACTPPTKYPAPAKQPGQQNAIPAEPPVQRARLAYLQQKASEPVVCTIGQDCTDKWARAKTWVQKNSAYSIKTDTDSEITTLGPIEPTTDAAFTITKTQADANTDTINFTSTCGTTTDNSTVGGALGKGKPAPCVPTSLELKSQFNNYLLTGN